MLTKKDMIGVWEPTPGQTVIGRRWQCKNPEDSLGTGLFPRLLVTKRRGVDSATCWRVLPIVVERRLCFPDRLRRGCGRPVFPLHLCRRPLGARASRRSLRCDAADTSALIEETLKAWCPGTPVVPLALSVKQLRQAQPARCDEVAGYALADLDRQDFTHKLRPTHPKLPFLREAVGDLLGPALGHRNRHFLSVGVTKYRDGEDGPGLHDLQSCDADASDMDHLFRRRFGYTTVTTEINPDAARFGDALDRFCSQIQPGDLAVVFFAGHGYQARNCTYLIPSTAAAIKDEKAVVQHGVNHWKLLGKLFARGAGQVVLILDCCQAWMRVARGGGTEGLPPSTETNGISSSAATTDQDPATMFEVQYSDADYLIFQAVSPSQLATDGPSNGVFTTHLKQAFSTATADTDLTTLARKITQAVVQDQGHNAMRPCVTSSIRSPFYIFAQQPTTATTADGVSDGLVTPIPR
eukprot:m.475340 g.475340  ORF g.475340 m.475340 type:complete len:466 (-) comp20395_c0_seq18:25-1422(-)